MSEESKTPFVNVARITKTHGSAGEVITIPVDDLPFLLYEGLEVMLTPPALSGKRWHKVESVRQVSKGYLISLEGIKNLNESTDLVGKLCLVSRKDIDEDDLLPEDYYDSLIGRRVEDVDHGYVGKIVEVILTPANDVWVLDGSEYGEILIPIIEKVVDEESIPDEGPIKVTLLKGLVEW